MCSRDCGGVVLGRSVQYGGPSLLRKRRSNRNSDRTNEGHDGDQTRNQNQNGKANNVRQILIENHWSLCRNRKISITFSGKSNDGQGENTNERKTSENNGEHQTAENTDDTNSEANHVNPSMRT